MEKQLGVAAVTWVTRVTRKLAPWILGGLVFFFSGLSPARPPVLAIVDGYGENHPPLGVLIGVSAIAGLLALIARRNSWPLLLGALPLWAMFTMYPVVMAASYYAAIRFTRRAHALVFLAVAAGAVVIPVAFGFMLAEDDLGMGIFVGVVALSMAVVLPYAIGLWVSARRQVIAGLHERAARLELEQAARAEQARSDERARIAREMHDVVAHRVALMVLHAGALEVSSPDERLAAEAAIIRTTGREALTELRQVLGVLRGAPADAVLAPQPDLSDVDRLVAQTRGAGVPVTLDLAEAGAALPLIVQRTAYRVVQEALTNVVKHAGGAETEVALHCPGRTLEIRVENGPPAGQVDRLPGSGLGLIGLRERVALVKGSLIARPRLDGGFLLTASLPLDSYAEAPSATVTGVQP